MGFSFGKFWAAGPFSSSDKKGAIEKYSDASNAKNKRTTKISKFRSSSTDTSNSAESPSTRDGHTKSANVQLVEAWMAAWQRKDFDLIVSMSLDKCEYLVPISESETMKVKLVDFFEQMKATYASFPDYDTEWDEMRDSKDNTVRIKNFVTKGTHTGEPFAFGPYPPMPAQGKKIRDNPVDVLVYIDKKSAKIEKVRILSKPNVTTGPGVYYLQVGGYIP